MTASLQAALRRFAPQLIALAAILALNAAVFPGFFDLTIQNGRLYGSLGSIRHDARIMQQPFPDIAPEQLAAWADKFTRLFTRSIFNLRNAAAAAKPTILPRIDISGVAHATLLTPIEDFSGQVIGVAAIAFDIVVAAAAIAEVVAGSAIEVVGFGIAIQLVIVGTANQRVEARQVVGTVGGEGTPEGPHMEFQVRMPLRGGVPEAVDPLGWLRSRAR